MTNTETPTTDLDERVRELTTQLAEYAAATADAVANKTHAYNCEVVAVAVFIPGDDSPEERHSFVEDLCNCFVSKLANPAEALRAHNEAVWEAGSDSGYTNSSNWDGWRFMRPEIKNPYRAE